MPNKCPLCEAPCSFENYKDNQHLIHVQCEKKHSFFMPISLMSVDENDSMPMKIRFYNIMNEYLLAHHERAVVEGDPCDFIFYTKECELTDVEESRFVDLDNEVLNYPRSFIEKIDRALVNLSRRYPHYGTRVIYNDTLARTLFLEEGDRILATLNFIVDLGYLDIIEKNPIYQISAMGWKHISELTKDESEVDQGFIAMAFRQETEEIREAFKKSIQDCMFMVRIMDEKEHNNQIVPEMFYEIRRSKFMVVDITYPNYGAYYEAGYAQALGKEVIICCRKAEFVSTDKATRPHFDISQKPTIVWETYEELREKLAKRIYATARE